MSVNLATCHPRVREYLELKQQQALLQDQIKSVQSNLKHLEVEVKPILLQYQEQNVAVTPAQHEIDRYGDAGSLKLRMYQQYDSLSQQMIAEYSERFYQEVMPEIPSQFASALAIQHTKYLWDHRPKKELSRIERTYTADMEERKKKRRRKDADGPPRVKRPKIQPVINDAAADNALRATLIYHTPHVLKRLEDMSNQTRPW